MSFPQPDNPFSQALPIPEGATIQGRKPGSSIEYYVAMALERLQVGYIYQYSVLGGSRVRGGQVVDFLVMTRPIPTPVEVNGDYWHRDPEKELFDMGRLRSAFQNSVAEPVIIWEHEALTPDAALATVKTKLRL